MAFWGVEVKSSKPYSHTHDTTRGRLHISQATLGIGSSSTQRSLLQCNVGNKSPVYLCSLLPDKIESCPLNLEFEEEEEVIFSVLGPRSVHLSGFYIDKSANAHGDGDETDSYGEDIGETESEHSTDFGTEDEYEDDFIDDNDIEMYSPSPRRNRGVVLEEITDDDLEPINRNACRRRLKRKYQVSDSEDDNQKQNVVRGGSCIVESESNDIDALPNSSLPETENESSEVHGKPETVSKEKIKEKAEGSDQVIRAEEENEHVQASRTDRGVGVTDNSTLPSLEVGQENVEKPKKKKKKERSNVEKDRGVVGDCSVDVHNEDKFKIEAKVDDATQEESVRDVDGKPSNHKGFENTCGSTLSAPEVGQEKSKKSRRKKKSGTIEEKTDGVLVDDDIVHGEDKSQIVEANSISISQDHPIRDEADEKPSNDKVVGKPNDSFPFYETGQESVEKSKKRKKKRGKAQLEEVKVDDTVNVHKEDKSLMEEARPAYMSQETVRAEAEKKAANDKGVEKPDDSLLPSLEITEKPKKKKKKERTKEGKASVVPSNNMFDVQKEDKLQVLQAKGDDIMQEDPVSSKEDEKASTDKVVIDENQVVEEGPSEKKHRKKTKNKTPDVDGNINEEAREGLLVEAEDGKSKKKSRKRSQPKDMD